MRLRGGGTSVASTNDVAAAKPPPTDAVETPEPDQKIREWTGLTGETLKAEFIITMGDQAVFKTENGKTTKIPLTQLSKEDLEYIDLESPLKLSIDFLKKSTQIPNPPLSPFLNGGQRPLKRFNFSFGARVKQTTARTYSHKLAIEYFAVGKEVDGNRYILLERHKDSFIHSHQGEQEIV